MDVVTQKKWDRAAANFDLMASFGPEKRWLPYKSELFDNMGDGKILFLAVGTGLDVPAPGSSVRLNVYSVDGRLVRTLVDGHRDPGIHGVDWDGRDNRGRRVGNGVYLYRLQTVAGDLTHKVFYIR